MTLIHCRRKYLQLPQLPRDISIDIIWLILFLGGYSGISQSQKDLISPAKKVRNLGRPKIAPLSLSNSSGHPISLIPKCLSGHVPSTRGLISEVLPGIFLGDEVNAEDRACMLKYNITDVFNVTSDLPNVFEADKTLNLNYIRFAVTDDMTSDLQLYFRKSHDIIGKTILVCCHGIYFDFQSSLS